MLTRRRLILILLGTVLVTAGRGASAQIDRAKLSRLHAAFVLNFMKFTQWPETPDRPLRVLVIDSHTVGEALRQAAEGRTVQQQPLGVDIRHAFPDQDAEDPEWDRFLGDAEGYDAVYAPAESPAALARLTASLAGEPVLIISDTAEGLAAGSHLAFAIEDDRVIFHANLKALEASPIALRAGLLRLARIHR